MKKFFAIFIAHQASFWSKKFGRGGGGALPGLLAEKIYPDIIPALSGKLSKGLIFVTGTNGKTTTSKLITEILETSGLRVINNYGGSNLSRGLASILIEKTHLITGKIDGDIGVYEIDEATMPQVTKLIQPKVIVVTNIFRDQLDRYGEVDKTAAIIAEAIKNSPQSTLILNADDPLVASLGKSIENTLYFGIEEPSLSAFSTLAIDSKNCILCGTELTYSTRYYGHVGIYKCPKCGYVRPQTIYTASKVFLGPDRLQAKIDTPQESLSLDIPMVGLYNLYNVLAAVATVKFFEIDSETVSNVIKNFSAAFGRMENFIYTGKNGIIHLIKNPTGLNQVLEAITKTTKPSVVIVALNDNFADGTDISWIWDSELELLKNFKKIIVSGIRAEEVQLRLKYANFDQVKVVLEKDLAKALSVGFDAINPNENLYILPTYTAMLSLRQILVTKGLLQNYWQKN